MSLWQYTKEAVLLDYTSVTLIIISHMVFFILIFNESLFHNIKLNIILCFMFLGIIVYIFFPSRSESFFTCMFFNFFRSLYFHVMKFFFWSSCYEVRRKELNKDQKTQKGNWSERHILVAGPINDCSAQDRERQEVWHFWNHWYGSVTALLTCWPKKLLNYSRFFSTFLNYS